MPHDIYTKAPIANLSDEHVLLNALGGRLKSGELIDQRTNSTFGNTIDADLADFVLPLRVLLDARAGDGGAPPPYRGATTADGERYNLLPGGKPELGRPKVEFSKTASGDTKIEGRARNLRELRRLTERKLGDLGVSFDEVEKSAKKVEQHAPPIAMSLVIDPGVKRAIAKMACNLLAVGHRDVFMRAEFDPIRELVLNGVGSPDDFVAVNTKPVDIAARKRAMAELDHLLVVRADKSGAVDGLVVLFEHLQFVVRLGRCSPGQPLVTTYRVNQMTRESRLDDEADRKIRPREFAKVRQSSDAAARHHLGEAVRRIMRVATRESDSRYLDEMIKKSIDEVLGPDEGKLVTEQHIDDLSRRLAERFVRYAQHRGQLGRLVARLEQEGQLDD